MMETWLLILGMACVNFTNLATARATQRAREVALRKVLGATRKQLIVQFIGESILILAIATLVGLALVELALPWVNAFLDAQIAIRYFALDGLLLPVIALTLLVGLAGGIYPAIVLSRFEPARVLKAEVPVNTAITTVQGQTFTINASLVITDQNMRTSSIVATDVFTSNGVIHVVDKVILPK